MGEPPRPHRGGCALAWARTPTARLDPVARLKRAVSAAGDAASIERSGNEIVVNSGSVACNVAPTVRNTDRIVVNDTSGQGTRLRIDVGGGPFAPGASDEAGVRHGRRDGRRRHPRARAWR